MERHEQPYTSISRIKSNKQTIIIKKSLESDRQLRCVRSVIIWYRTPFWYLLLSHFPNDEYFFIRKGPVLLSSFLLPPFFVRLTDPAVFHIWHRTSVAFRATWWPRDFGQNREVRTNRRLQIPQLFTASVKKPLIQEIGQRRPMLPCPGSGAPSSHFSHCDMLLLGLFHLRWHVGSPITERPKWDLRVQVLLSYS